MIYYVSYLKDVLGNNYLGINIPNSNVNSYLQDLKKIIDNDSLYEDLVKNQQNRDDNGYHITLMSVMEYNSLLKKYGPSEFINQLNPIFSYEIDDLRMLGVGSVERAGNRAYYIVVESDKLDHIRNKFELDNKDLHITLGFKYKDVFGLKKDRSTIISVKSTFLKLLERLYYNNNENWDFVKTLKGYDADLEAEIIPLEITDTQFVYRVGGKYMHLSCIGDDNEIAISCKYDGDTNKPRLSTTEIAQIFKNK